MSGKRLASATFHYGLAAYLPKLLNFLLLPLYATRLSPAEMGVLEVMAAVDTLVVAVSRLGLPGALSRAYFDDKSDNAFRDQLVTISIATLFSGLLFSALVLLAGPYVFARWISDVPFHPFVLLSLIAALLRAAPEIQSRLLQVRELASLASRINIGISLAGTAARVILVVGLDRGIEGALWAEVITSAIGALIAVVRHRDDLVGRFRLELLRPSLSYGLPLVPHRLGAWVAESSTRWILAGTGALSAIGNIAVATRLASPIQIAVNAFTTAFAPIYFGWRADLPAADALREARKASASVCGLAAVTAVAVTTGGVVILRWILPSGYREAAGLIGIVTATLVVRVVYSMVSMELFYSKRTGGISIVFVLGAVITIGLTAPLTEAWGARGAVTAQFVGITASVLVTVMQARKTFPLTIGARSVAVVVATSVFAVIAPEVLPGASFLGDIAWGTVAAIVGMGVVIAASGVRPAQLRALRRGKGKGPASSAPDVPAE